METVAAISVGFLILVALLVAIKTFSLWYRTRAVPEFLLGGYLTCATVLGYPLVIASSQVSPAQMWPLHVAGPAMTSVGFTCLLLFTLNVFRPEARWAKAIVGVSVLVFSTGVALTFIEMTGANPRGREELIGINLVTTTPIAFAYLWTTIESLHYYQRLKLRLRLGLADVEVANRMLLWGLMTLSAGIAVMISLVGMLLGSFLTTTMVFVLSCLGTFQTCCLFLAFHPPGWYRGWLERARSQG